MKAKYRKLLIYTMIMVFQLLVILYWAKAKTNYHIDELYSMTHASGFTAQVYNSEYITISRDFHLNEWTENSVFKKYLIVSDAEKTFRAPFSAILNGFVMFRNYYGLLNLAESIAGLSYVSAAPGLVLNIIFFILTELSLLSLLRKLRVDERIRCLAVAMFGFSGYIISTVEYIRFYMLVIMFMMFLLNCFYNLWNADTWKAVALYELAILVIGYFSFRDSELTLLFLGAFTCAFFVGLVVYRKKKQYVSFIGLGAVGLTYIICFTNYINILIAPDKYGSSADVAKAASDAIRETSVGTISLFFQWLKALFGMHLFGHRYIFYLFLAIAIVGVIVLIVCNRVEKKGVYSAKNLKSVRISLSSDTVFMAVTACEVIIYTALCAVCQFMIWRYYCFGFVSIFILFWYFLDRIIKRKPVQSVNHLLVIALSVFVVIIAIVPFSTRRIENIYEDEKDFIEGVGINNDLDVVLMLMNDKGVISRHETYDCIQIMPESTKIFATDISEYDYSCIDFPNEFMLWTHEERDVTVVLQDLKTHGYKIEELGKDHCSKAYVCKL